MCTVTWIHQPDGYHLFCNRDEKKSRPAALPPRLQARGWVRFLSPIDLGSGGSWIAVNEFGLSACLLNGTPAVMQGSFRRTSEQLMSRGAIVRELIWAPSVDEGMLWLKQLDLERFAPFTVLLLEQNRCAAVASWNHESLTISDPADAMMPLTSSSLDPHGVRYARLQDFGRRLRGVGSTDSRLLEEFHASSGQAHDAYSSCMHRSDAETVSFSRILVSRDRIEFLYSPGPPCELNGTQRLVLDRAA